MKQALILVATLLLGTVGSFSQTTGECPPPCPYVEYEQCKVGGDPTEFQNCQARNRDRDNKFQECLRQRQKACNDEQKQREEHEKYCRQNPDAADCK